MLDGAVREPAQGPRAAQPARGRSATIDPVRLAAGTHRHGRTDEGLRCRAEAKLADIEQRITDLTIIRESLRQAIDAGCDDLMECAGSPRCPLPFTARVTPAKPGAPTARPRRG